MNALNRTEMQITVDTPRPPSPRRDPTVVRGGDAGFEPATAEIMVGQSMVALGDTPARFVVGPLPQGT